MQPFSLVRRFAAEGCALLLLGCLTGSAAYAEWVESFVEACGSQSGGPGFVCSTIAPATPKPNFFAGVTPGLPTDGLANCGIAGGFRTTTVSAGPLVDIRSLSTAFNLGANAFSGSTIVSAHYGVVGAEAQATTPGTVPFVATGVGGGGVVPPGFTAIPGSVSGIGTVDTFLIPLVWGDPIDLEFGILASVIPSGGFHAAVDFYSTATLTGIERLANGQPITNFSVVSDSGTLYDVGGAHPVPEPSVTAMISAGLMAITAFARRKGRRTQRPAKPSRAILAVTLLASGLARLAYITISTQPSTPSRTYLRNADGTGVTHIANDTEFPAWQFGNVPKPGLGLALACGLTLLGGLGSSRRVGPSVAGSLALRGPRISKRPVFSRFARLVLCLMAVAIPVSSALAQSVVSASPDVTIALGPGNLVTTDHAVAVDNRLGIVALQNLGAIPQSADVTGYADAGGGMFLFVLDTTASFPSGIVAGPNDVVAWDGASHSLRFDGSVRGVPNGVRIDAVGTTVTDGLLLSFDTDVSLPGGVNASDEDLVEFSGTSFRLVLDGSTIGIDRSLDIDGAQDIGGGYLVSFDTHTIRPSMGGNFGLLGDESHGTKVLPRSAGAAIHV